MVRAVYPEVKTERGRTNKLYLWYAVRVLKNNEQLFNWYQELKPYPEGVLSGIGVIAQKYSEQDAIELARQFHQNKTSMKDALRIVRNYRAKPKDVDPLELANAIIHTINDYWKRFPKLTKEQIADALRTAGAQVEGM